MKILLKYWQSLTPITQKIGIFLLINILINIGLFILPSVMHIHDTLEYYTKETVISHTKNFFTLGSNEIDSWVRMQNAFDYIKVEHEKPLYDEIFFHQKLKFQYPTTSLIVFSFLNSIDGFLKSIGQSQYGILKNFSWLCVVVTIFFVIQIFNLSFARNVEANKKHSSKIDLITRNTLLVILALIFYPLIKAFTVGQIQVWINCLFTILFWCWMKDKKLISGIIAGTMCLIKPQYVVILLWGVLRKKFSFALAMSATIFTGTLVSILLFGFADNLNYLSVISFISKHGESFYPNQSINGLLNRLLFNGNNLEFTTDSFPPFNPVIYVGTTISSIALVSLALFPPKKPEERGSITDFAIVALTCTIASPVAWEHHYGILLAIYAFLLPCLLSKQVFGRVTILYFCISYFLASNYFAIARQLAYAKFNLNILQSYLFFGALMLLICLYALRSIKMNDPTAASCGVSKAETTVSVLR